MYLSTTILQRSFGLVCFVDRPMRWAKMNCSLGKDYSNPRVTDFHTLNKPFDDMYDRGKVPRMPW